MRGAGSPNIAEFVNRDKFVHCDVPRADVLALRSHSFTKGDHTSRDAQEAERLQWVRDTQPRTMAALRKCAAEVVALDRDDEAYIAMLRAPLLPPGVDWKTSIWSYEAYGAKIREVLALYGSDLLD